MGSVRGAASAPISTVGLGFCGERVTTASPAPIPAAQRRWNAPIVRAHRWAPITHAHRLGSGHPSWAPTGDRRVLIRGAHWWRPPASGRPGRLPEGSRTPSPALIARRRAPIGGWWQPIRGNLWGAIGAAPCRGDRGPCGLIFSVAVCTHRGCFWGRLRAAISGAHCGRPPPSYALIGEWRRAIQAF
jgi:hypothetical protein